MKFIKFIISENIDDIELKEKEYFACCVPRVVRILDEDKYSNYEENRLKACVRPTGGGIYITKNKKVNMLNSIGLNCIVEVENDDCFTELRGY